MNRLGPLRQNLVEGAYCLFFYLFDWISLNTVQRQDREGTNKVLLVRLDAIGDFILWLDAAQQLKYLYPEKKLILIANRTWVDLARIVPLWDEVWELDRRSFVRNLKYRFSMLKKIWRTGFHIALQPTFSREFSYGDSVIRASQAVKRIGSVGDCANILPVLKKISDAFYTQLVPASSFMKMELKRNAEFMRGLGVTMKAGLPDLRRVCETIKNPLKNKANAYYIMSPGASRDFRRWPITKFAALAENIYRRKQLTCLICGLSTERPLSKALQKKTDVPTINMTGKTTLTQLTTIIRDALFVVGNETSAIHFAAAVSTPAFCLLGGGHYGRFMPYDLEIETERPLPVPIIHKMDCFGCNWKCRYSIKKGAAVPCIDNISVDEVFDLLRPVLEDKL